MRRTCATRIIWFYRPDCIHCANMKPEWNKFKTQALFSVSPIDLREIDINDPLNAALVANYKVNSVPFVIKLKENGFREIYGGDRSAQDLLKWSKL